ncbi:SLC25A17 isoform 11 [Pan troglodytes]|uniref:Solute carrier family 25 member 17 n=3 Tax=Hominidae TaxID=9604 RepID=F2Z2I9_HUMAN|nr:SLC25A17 isoform 1 [Pan troglodytes]PNJ37501.1 SLC25A17 isoform 1 [Pongo abelii]PNI48736.1 SLC25A17 isoform 5 [Pan troglodytes]PNI48740.1 SLC25A17 isoform 9 [Pan troglodytes]PNI48741.1 SLC25A17 isoform 11 [Pan troglodytes]
MASVLSYESLVHAVAGAVGSVTAMTVFFPLDTARLRLQDLFKLKL